MDDEEFNFVKDDVIYIHDHFGSDISKHVIPAFKRLIIKNEKLKDGKIVIDIASNGGYVDVLFELIALVEQSKALGITVETRAMSHAHSCGAMLLMSGSKGYRYASPLTCVLVHHPRGGDYFSTHKQIERSAAYALNISDNFKKLIHKYTKVSKSKMNEMFGDDNYYIYGQDLITLGIVDEFTYDL